MAWATLLALITACNAGTAPAHECASLRMAMNHCGGAELECVKRTLDRGSIEVTPRGVTILRGGS